MLLYQSNVPSKSFFFRLLSVFFAAFLLVIGDDAERQEVFIHVLGCIWLASSSFVRLQFQGGVCFGTGRSILRCANASNRT
jgi:hypothetical protein